MASDDAMRRTPGPAKGFIIAGPASGVGKTTVSLAIMAALQRRGLSVQPFKCGPDFIDGGHHARVCGRASRNLDGWMLSADTNRQIFYSVARCTDVCVVEGMMGLFDGVDGRSEAGSTAELAKWLNLPVILVVDASSSARSTAALVHGFETFDPVLKVAGVIFNKVAGAAHYRMLEEAVKSGTRAVPLGYLPRDERIHIPERYLGLFTAGEKLLPAAALTSLGEWAQKTIDLDRLLNCADFISFDPPHAYQQRALPSNDSICIGVARDQAFCFYYEENLDALRQAGAEIIEFSPLADSSLPDSLDALYFGGGYPELFARQLSENRRMLGSIRAAAHAGFPIYAECGGLMYLARKIVSKDGTSHPMAGVLPLDVGMTDKLVNFGYTEVSFKSDCLLGETGTKARGHSFHCSTIIDTDPLERVYDTRNSMTGREGTEGFRIKNVLASYIHLHFLSNPGIADSFLRNARVVSGSRSTAAAKSEQGRIARVAPEKGT